MRTPSVRQATYIKLFATLGALVGSSALVWQASHSAYTSTTGNPGNSWAAGQVILTDDDGGSTAMFTATGLKPGSTGQHCIKVSSTSTVASVAKLYATSYSTTSALGAAINLTIEQGTVGAFSGCGAFVAASTPFSGTLDAFGTTDTSYATGIGNWSIAGTPTETQVYRFTYTVSSSAADSTQGGTASIGFTWQAQSS